MRHFIHRMARDVSSLIAMFRYMKFRHVYQHEFTSVSLLGSFRRLLLPPLWLNDASLEVSAVKNGSKNNYKQNNYQNLAFRSILLKKSRKQLVTSRKSSSHGRIKTAEILMKYCFDALQLFYRWIYLQKTIKNPEKG